jgi:SSS family transporter
LPDLPHPRWSGAAAFLDHTLVVAGGRTLRDPEGDNALLTLDLRHAENGWGMGSSFPGTRRVSPVLVAQDESLILAGGARGGDGSDVSGIVDLLQDAYRYTRESGWTVISAPPVPVCGGAGVAIGTSHVLAIGVARPSESTHPEPLDDTGCGVSTDVVAYHTITDTWVTVGHVRDVQVIHTAAAWAGDVVVAGPGKGSDVDSDVVATIQIQAGRGRFSTVDVVVVVLYFALLIGMGFFFARRERTTRDYFLAGNRVPWWAAGLSIFGTQLSAITFLAAPARTYATDWIYFIVMVTIVMVAPAVVYLFIPVIRKTEITSAYEYLERRFNLAVRLFGSAAFVLFQIGRVGIVIFLPALALAAVTGFHIVVCILAIGVLSTMYTALGGIEAVVWTDVAQVVVLMGGALLAFVIIVTDVEGGWTGFLNTALEDDKFHMFNWTWDVTVEAFWLVLVGNLFANLVPYTTDQSVIQRYLTTPSEEASKRAVWTNAWMTLPAAFLFFGLGTALYVFYKESPALLDPTLHTDAILPLFIVQQLPVGVRGLTIAGIFAAAMSSLDSSLNSVATALVTDWIRRFRSRLSDASALVAARWITVVFGVVGTGMALLLSSAGIGSLLDLFREILGLFGGSLLGLFGLGILTRRANGTGALVGAFTSAAVLFAVQQTTDIHFFLYAAIGATTCFVTGYAVSVWFSPSGVRSEPNNIGRNP